MTVFIQPPPVNRQHWQRFTGSVLSQTLLRWAGWRIDWHGLPAPHGVIVAYPHTSNWDFVVGILAKWAIGMPLRFWAKEGLFTGWARFTIGPLMRYWGAIPVNRRSASGMIDDTVRTMQTTPYAWLALAPEGTRSHTDYWRSGFYQVALKANVPLGLAYFDFEHKIVGITEFIQLTGDESQDLAIIADYYTTRSFGRNPSAAGTIAFRTKL